MATHLLQIDASARPGRAGMEPHGSHTRALTDRFVSRWLQSQPGTCLTTRDVGLAPPPLVDADWIRAAFTPADALTDDRRAALACSDTLIGELRQADVVVLGAPMYNFGIPAGLKAWIDQIVRIGVSFDYRPQQQDPYVPLLAERPRRVVILASRGGHGFDAGGAMAHMNHADTQLRTALAFVGITDVDMIAIEHEETGGEPLQASVHAAQCAVDRLVDRWAGQRLAA